MVAMQAHIAVLARVWEREESKVLRAKKRQVKIVRLLL